MTAKQVLRYFVDKPWETTSAHEDSNAPTPRYGHSAVTYMRYMFVFGGRNTTCLADLWKFDPVACLWTPIRVEFAPPPRAGHTAVVYRGHMYIFGGGGESPDDSQNQWFNDLWDFDLTTLLWEERKLFGGTSTPHAPAPRRGHTAHVWNNNMYIFGGGQDDATMYNDLWSYDFMNDHWRSIPLLGIDLPLPRMYHVSCLSDCGHLFIFGGLSLRNNRPHMFLDDLIKIHLESGKFFTLRTTGAKPSPRMCSTAVYQNRTIAVFSGGAQNYLTDAYQIDLDSLYWEDITSQIGALRGLIRPTTVVFRDSLITFGGGVSKHTFVNDTHVLRFRPITLRSLCIHALSPRKMHTLSNELPPHLTEDLWASLEQHTQMSSKSTYHEIVDP